MITISEVLITISKFFIQQFIEGDLGLGQFDNINRMLTLSMIALSGFYCIIKPTIFKPTIIKPIIFNCIFKLTMFTGSMSASTN
jgi:hypothetical protein